MVYEYRDYLHVNMYVMVILMATFYRQFSHQHHDVSASIKTQAVCCVHMYVMCVYVHVQCACVCVCIHCTAVICCMFSVPH